MTMETSSGPEIYCTQTGNFLRINLRSDQLNYTPQD